MATAGRFFLYARKSTDVEDKQIMSIEAQLAELRDFAMREHLDIIEELVEKQSAKVPGRPVFNGMLDRIERGEASGIIAWHPDRLARNSLDGGRIIYRLDTGHIAALKFPTFWFEPTPQGKFMLSLAFGQSKYYVDSLAENTKRGIRAKIRRKQYPGLAPFGYLNDYRTKSIIIDAARAPLVKEVYEKYATGKETLRTMRVYLAERGIRSSGGKLLGATFVSRLLSNPIYYGYFDWKGEVYEGSHDPIITKALFDEVQAILNRRWKYSPGKDTRQPKAFGQLFKCATCGYTVTAEIQKGHTYYHCSRKNPDIRCRGPFVREEVLDAEISRLLLPLAPYENWSRDMHALLEHDLADMKAASSPVIAEARKECDAVTSRLLRLRDAFLDGVIERAEYLTEKKAAMSTKKTIEDKIAALTRGDTGWVEPFKEWISEAQSIAKVAHTTDLTEKGHLAKKVFGSNLVLDVKKARGEAVEPWSLLSETRPGDTLVSVYNAARTHFQRRAGAYASLGPVACPSQESNVPLGAVESNQCP